MIGTAQGQTIGTIDPYSGSLQNVSLWGVAFNQTEIDEISIYERLLTKEFNKFNNNLTYY